MPTKEIICLAYSRKIGGSCFAGLDLTTKQWIRAVSAHPHGTLSENDCVMSAGSGRYVLPSILDVIAIDFLAAEPKVGQPENWRISSADWRKLRRAGPVDIDTVKSSLSSDPELFRGYERSVTKQEIESRPLPIR